jgi:hypothetical protein
MHACTRAHMRTCTACPKLCACGIAPGFPALSSIPLCANFPQTVHSLHPKRVHDVSRSVNARNIQAACCLTSDTRQHCRGITIASLVPYLVFARIHVNEWTYHYAYKDVACACVQPISYWVCIINVTATDSREMLTRTLPQCLHLTTS